MYTLLNFFQYDLFELKYSSGFFVLSFIQNSKVFI